MFVFNVCRMTQTREQGIGLELNKASVSILLIQIHWRKKKCFMWKLIEVATGKRKESENAGLPRLKLRMKPFGWMATHIQVRYTTFWQVLEGKVRRLILEVSHLVLKKTTMEWRRKMHLIKSCYWKIKRNQSSQHHVTVTRNIDTFHPLENMMKPYQWVLQFKYRFSLKDNY